MTRFARKVISSGTNAWDAEANDNHLYTFDRPIPIIHHAGDLTSLEAAHPAATHDYSLAICQYSSTAGDGLIFAISNGTAWRPVSSWEFFNRQIRTDITNTYTVLITDDFISITGANTFDLTLPAIAGANNDRIIQIKHRGTGTVTVKVTGGDTIDGVSSFVMSNQYMHNRFRSDGTSDWMVT